MSSLRPSRGSMIAAFWLAASTLSAASPAMSQTDVEALPLEAATAEPARPPASQARNPKPSQVDEPLTSRVLTGNKTEPPPFMGNSGPWAGVPGPYDPPGYYGTYYGFPSYGMGQKYSQYPTPFRAVSDIPGQALFITPRGISFEPYRPGVDDFLYGRPRYGVWAVPELGLPPGAAPPIGVYAPSYGPGGPWFYTGR